MRKMRKQIVGRKALTSAAARRLTHDLKFLLSRPHEVALVLDMIDTIHDRRLWVEERERFERGEFSYQDPPAGRDGFGAIR